jgi:membrane fusion protein, multidrug efflux system
MRLFVRLIIVVALIAVIVGGIAYVKYGQFQSMEAKFSQPPPPATVEVAQVEEASWQGGLKAVGSFVAVNDVDVTAEVSGTVSEISFDSGQRVQQGDILVKLEDSVDQAASRALRADQELARVQFARYAELLPERAAAQSQYDEAKAKYEAAKARVAEQEARNQKKAVRAPFSGVLGLRRVDIGEYVAAGTPIVRLTELRPIYADYTVAERDLPKIEVGRAVEVKVAAYPDRTFKGRVTAMESTVNPGSRSVDVRATLENPDELLRPGMFADVVTLDPQQQQVLTVPRTAISFNTYGDYVYRIQSNDQDQLVVQQQQVTTGQTRDERVAVLDGLEAGQRVVAAGLIKLRNGQSVQIREQGIGRAPNQTGQSGAGAGAEVAAQ